MKFIMLLITFEAMKGGTYYKDGAAFENKFKEKYFKTFQIDEIEGPVDFKVELDDGKHYYIEHCCEIAFTNGHIGVVQEDCQSLMHKINGATK